MNPYTLTFQMCASANELQGWLRGLRRVIGSEKMNEMKKKNRMKGCEQSSQVTPVYIQFIGCVH